MTCVRQHRGTDGNGRPGAVSQGLGKQIESRAFSAPWNSDRLGMESRTDNSVLHAWIAIACRAERD